MPDHSGALDRFSMRGVKNLPNERPLVISFARFRVLTLVLTMLLVSVASFLTGVVAGTSGWYRETAVALSGAASSLDGMRAILLAPDRSGRPGVSERLIAIDDRLQSIEASQALALGERDRLLSDYIDFSDAIARAAAAAVAAEATSSLAAANAEATTRALDVYIAAVRAAQQARSAARPDSDPSP